MAHTFRTEIAVLACLLSPGLAAEAPDYLLRSAPLCDTEEVMCLRGSVRYLPGSRVMEVRGRVWRAPGPGWVSILFRGARPNGAASTAVMEFPIRGNASEIVDRRFIPDFPEVRYWRILGVLFEEDELADRAAVDQR
jgi:hypothetical protein